MAAPPVKSGYISSGPDLQLNYLEWGDPSAPPVLLIIGLTNFAYAWNETALALADRYRCVALNLRGHGDSGPSPEREYSFDLWDTDVQALVTTLELDRPVIMGHSLGGRVAFVYGARHPEHTQGVVVVDVGPGFPEEAAATVQKEFFGKMPADYESWEAGLAYRRLRQSPSISDETLEARAPYALRQLPDGRVIPKHDPLLRDEWLGDKPPARAQAHTWLWQDLANLQAPMLIVKGEKTPFLTHELCDQMCATTKGEARWAEIPGTTHAIMDDNLPGFLKEVEPFTAACMRA
jgi:pimeloyl-ACP methyl ester carboxylesterase